MTRLSRSPFDHIVLDNFLDDHVARQIEAEFPAFDAPCWHEYNNAIEVKRTCDSWRVFSRETYLTLLELTGAGFADQLRGWFGAPNLSPDAGLHGAGLHIHGAGGKLNPHLDYSLHPKTGLQRKLNLLIYLNSNWRAEWGGSLGLYEQRRDACAPGRLAKKIAPLFNRAVIFDTTQDSWHGLCEPVMCPEREYRKSLAVYYMTEPEANADRRSKALFAPTLEQERDESVLALIKRRSTGAYA